jgi:hypothetical protein
LADRVDPCRLWQGYNCHLLHQIKVAKPLHTQSLDPCQGELIDDTQGSNLNNFGVTKFCLQEWVSPRRVHSSNFLSPAPIFAARKSSSRVPIMRSTSWVQSIVQSIV